MNHAWKYQKYQNIDKKLINSSKIRIIMSLNFHACLIAYFSISYIWLKNIVILGFQNSYSRIFLYMICSYKILLVFGIIGKLRHFSTTYLLLS